MMRFELLAGLPPYGPSAIPFPADWHQTFREGLVVRFYGAGDQSWVGNFRRGVNEAFDSVTGFSSNNRVAVVVAGGEGYVVDIEERRQTHSFGGCIDTVEFIAELDLVVLCDNIGLAGFFGNGENWYSDRISWDGIRNIVVNDTILRGEAWSPCSRTWHSFLLDLMTGETQNSIYQVEIAAAIRIGPS